jgi:hydroxymethylbilane synthase
MQKIKIISRNSKLAMWQAEYVKEKLNAIYPDLIVEITGVVTQGDKILDKSLDKIGGKDLFIKELEQALLDGTADIAVHSLKDVSVNLNAEFQLAAILERGLANDAFISNTYDNLESMPNGAIIGTSSARRIALLKQYYPNLQTKLLRGNLPTRLNKLDNGEYDGIILASIGLIRLGLANRIRQQLDVKCFIPAIGQGALAIEIAQTRQDLAKFLAPLADSTTTLTVNSEREVGKLLNASCSTPLAVHATLSENEVYINALFADPNNNDHCYFASVNRPKSEYLAASTECANLLIQQISRIN